MDGVYDLGGLTGFGPIHIEQDEPVFHHDWEAFTYASVFLGNGGKTLFNVDEYRHAVERIDASRYLSSSYYERVLIASATLFVEKGAVTQKELEDRAGGCYPLALPVADSAGDAEYIDAKAGAAPTFSVGDEVKVLDLNTTGHTRVPRFVRGKIGIITHVAPAFTFPDANAHGKPDKTEPTYHVKFSGNELWGDSADENTSINVDLWQSYLEKT